MFPDTTDYGRSIEAIDNFCHFIFLNKTSPKQMHISLNIPAQSYSFIFQTLDRQTEIRPDISMGVWVLLFTAK